MVKKGMAREGEETSKETVTGLVEVVGAAEEVRDARIFDKVDGGTEKEGKE